MWSAACSVDSDRNMSHLFVATVAPWVDQPGRVAVVPRTSGPPEQQQRRPAVPVREQLNTHTNTHFYCKIWTLCLLPANMTGGPTWPPSAQDGADEKQLLNMKSLWCVTMNSMVTLFYCFFLFSVFWCFILHSSAAPLTFKVSVFGERRRSATHHTHTAVTEPCGL